MDVETSRGKLSRDFDIGHDCGASSGHRCALQTAEGSGQFPTFLCFQVSHSLMQNGHKSVSQYIPGDKVYSLKRDKFTNHLL